MRRLYGPSVGYDAEPSKSWLVVKESEYDEAVKVFKDTDVKITKQKTPSCLCRSNRVPKGIPS